MNGREQACPSAASPLCRRPGHRVENEPNAVGKEASCEAAVPPLPPAMKRYLGSWAVNGIAYLGSCRTTRYRAGGLRIYLHLTSCLGTYIPRVLCLLQVGWADNASGWGAAPFAQPVTVPDRLHRMNGRSTAVTALRCCWIGWPRRDEGRPQCARRRACEEGGLAGGPCLSTTP